MKNIIYFPLTFNFYRSHFGSSAFQSPKAKPKLFIAFVRMATEYPVCSEQFASKDSVQFSSMEARSQAIKAKLDALSCKQRDDFGKKMYQRSISCAESGSERGTHDFSYSNKPKRSSDSQDATAVMVEHLAMFNPRVRVSSANGYSPGKIPHNEAPEKSPKYPTGQRAASDTHGTKSASHRRDEESHRRDEESHRRDEESHRRDEESRRRDEESHRRDEESYPYSNLSTEGPR